MRQSIVRAFVRAIVAAAIAALAIGSISALGQSPKPTATKPAAAKSAVFDPSACLACHEPIKTLYGNQGKVRNAEFWLVELVNKFGQAQIVGVPEDALKAARAKHGEAHANWEWWTAVNGASFHNLDLAKESLARSVAASQDGIKILDDAMRRRRPRPSNRAASGTTA